MASSVSFLTCIKIAHRGLYTSSIPENSVAAFKHANEKGFAFETDVHFSKDKKLIIFHDENLKRMTGKDKLVSDCTLEEIKELHLNNTEEKIPTLEEILNLKLSVPILLEIKSQSKFKKEEFIEAIANAFKDYKGEYAIQSFNPLYVNYYKQICPNVQCGLLARDWHSKEDLGGGILWPIKAYLLHIMWFSDVKSLDFISYRLLDLPTYNLSNYKGIKLGWTSQSESDEKKAYQYVDNIIFERYIPSTPKVD